MTRLATPKQRINHLIKVPEVRVIGAEGEQLGILKTSEALRQARDAGYDLVEVAPTAEPPVCRIMDHGKFKYEQSKKEHRMRLNQKSTQVKEVKFRPGTDEGDYQVKLRNLTRFLEEGNKGKVTLRFRGREMAHQSLGIDLLNRIKEDLGDLAVVESFPNKVEGRQMTMMLAPKKK